MVADLSVTGTRLLHIGPHKTGTTAVQGALHLARERLAARGVVYPGRGRQPLWPILAVTGQPALLGGPRPEISYWGNLVRDVRAAVAEAELVRRLNEEFSRREWPHRNYTRFMRYGAVEHMKTARQPSRDEPRIATPAWALAQAAAISAEMAGRIEALGVNIIGDLSALGKLPEDASGPGADTRTAAPLIPVEAAARAALGAFIAAGAGGQGVEEIVRDLDARSLAKVLAKRCGQRVRRALPR
jgi:hypothetical protein